MMQEVLQYALFTGQLVDNRTRAQKQQDKHCGLPQQTEMFSQRELAQYVNPHPMMDVSPGALVLISEDPRTPEEKERDLQRAAERETYPLFLEQPSSVTTDEAKDDPPPVIEANPKHETYAKLVEVSREQASLVNPRPVTQLEYSLLLSLTKHEAKEVGLTNAEITAAVQVGRHMGIRDQRRFERVQQPAIQQEQRAAAPLEPDVYWLGRAIIQTLAPSRF